jgi:hypothetical protein
MTAILQSNAVHEKVPFTAYSDTYHPFLLESTCSNRMGSSVAAYCHWVLTSESSREWYISVNKLAMAKKEKRITKMVQIKKN